MTLAPAVDELISRPRLVERLEAARETPLVLLVAPAGYGKTTLLSEWALSDGRPFAWVELREPDRDPRRLLRSIAAALLAAGVVEGELVPALADSDGGDLEAALGGVCDAIGRAPLVLVLDGGEVLDAPQSLAVVTALLERAGHGIQVALASRGEPALGLGGLRARRKLLELRSAELALTPAEAAAVAFSYDLDLDRDELDLLMRRTEGWPAGVSLAALAARDEPYPEHELAAFGGDDRFVSDYLREEVLAPLPPRHVEFLARTSILDRLSGPVCDHVLERADSARLLTELSRMNLMLVPLDRRDLEYRYHRLFAETLRGELRRTERQLEARLHRRASAWYEHHGDVERSIHHALEGDDLERAGDLLWAHAADIAGYGQPGQLERWLGRFSDEQLTACARLALTAAASSLLAGDRELAEHWTAAALRRLDRDERADEALVAEALLIRAAVADDSVARMGAQAESACRRMPEHSPWRALGDLLQGTAHHLSGDRDRGRELLEQGARRAAPGSPGLQCLCLAQLALTAVDAEDWEAAESLASRARAQAERSGFHCYGTSALVYAVSAEVHAHTGRIEASKDDLADASRLLDELAGFTPWYEAECRIVMARAAVRLSDVQEARALITEASRRLRPAADAQVAFEWVRDCRRRAALSSASSAGEEWALTTAELRILQFLPTYLSLREIAERLFVSSNTVKTHARSVYRKLGASSRGDAVVRARRAGLLDEASHAGVPSAPLPH